MFLIGDIYLVKLEYIFILKIRIVLFYGDSIIPYSQTKGNTIFMKSYLAVLPHNNKASVDMMIFCCVVAR